ncbi:MAG: hypothetical protein R3E48_16245 [Burkholderiaceae bacterium]
MRTEIERIVLVRRLVVDGQALARGRRIVDEREPVLRETVGHDGAASARRAHDPDRAAGRALAVERR